MNGKVQVKRKWSSALAVFVLAFALMFMADAFSNAALAATTAKVTAKSANIRKEPNSTSAAVGSAVKDTKVEIISQTTGADGKTWYQIYVDGKNTGYVRSDLVEITDGTEPPAAGGAEAAGTGSTGVTDNSGAEQLVPVAATVSGSNTVRVRTSASTANSNNILSTVNKGTNVTVVARTTGDDKKTWYQIKFQADGKDVIGYIRSDYLTLSGDVTPLSEAQPSVPDEPAASEPEPQPEQPETPPLNKRYDTKLISEKWYILDYEAGKQYEVDKLFSAADEYKALYETAQGKVKAQKVGLFVLGFLAIALLAAAGYLVYRVKEYKEEAYIASIENNTLNRRRTAERPSAENRKPAGDRPVIREGVPARDGAQGERRPAQGQRPAGPQVQNGQKPAGAQNGQKPAGAQNGQRPAPAQGQRPAQNGQRPAPAQGQRPVQNGQRPAPAQKPAAQRPAPQEKPAAGRNFAQGGSDDMDFETINWDSDEE